jgi:coenzyme F420 hydrogenase subunit beta
MTDTVQCIGCGLCSSYDATKKLQLCQKTGTFTPLGNQIVSVKHRCPVTINYKTLYNDYYQIRSAPDQLGVVQGVYTASAVDDDIRRSSASGGVISSVLIYLLTEKIVDAVIIAYQPENRDFADVTPIIVTDPKAITSYSGSVYTTVPMLKIISELDEHKKYAITLIPEHAATLRQLQLDGDIKANAVQFVAGLMTGTTLTASSIDFLLKREKAKASQITSFKWRYGDWPGSLRIGLSDGRLIEHEKIYYNFLIPSFIAPHSLGSHDFYNEFSDISIGDAWDSDLERRKRGISLLITRSSIGTKIINDMTNKNILQTSGINHGYAQRMHAHMYEFKKRGSFIRTKVLSLDGIPNFGSGYSIKSLNYKRVLVERLLSFIMRFAQSKLYLRLLEIIPLEFIGPIFNYLRLRWKKGTVKIKRHSEVLIKW